MYYNFCTFVAPWIPNPEVSSSNLIILKNCTHGGLAQMVERALSMREVLGSMPRSSTPFLSLLLVFSPQFDSEDMFYV